MRKIPEFEGKKSYHHKDLRGALLRAGESLLAEMSAENVTLREIARKAGVSHAAPKHHFPVLGDLLAEIAARGFERFVQELQTAADESAIQEPRSRLEAMGRAYVQFAKENEAIYGLMFGKGGRCTMTPHLVVAGIAAWSQLEQAVADVVGRAMAANGAIAVWSAVHGFSLLLLERRFPPDISPQSSLEPMLRMIMAGIAAEG